MFNSLDEFEVVGVISNNDHNTFYKVFHKTTGKYYVLKAVDYGFLPEESKELLMSEVSLLTSLTHPNIVKHYKHFVHEPSFTLYIVTEYCSDGDLQTLLMKCRNRCSYLEESFIWRVLYQIGRAVQVFNTRLSQMSVIIPDVRLCNVFTHETGNIQLGNFNVSNYLDNFQTKFDKSISSSSTSIHTELHNLGQLVYDLCFAGTHVTKNKSNERIPSIYSEDLQKIINLMRNPSSDMKNNMDVVLYHPVVLSRITINSLEHLTIVTSNKTRFGSRESVTSKEKSNIECVTCDEYKTKLKSIEEKEKTLNLRENVLKGKEEMLIEREQHIRSLETTLKEKVRKVDRYLERTRNKKKFVSTCDGIEADLDSSGISFKNKANLVQSVVRLSPSKVVKPKCMRHTPVRRTVHFPNLPVEEVNVCNGSKENCKHKWKKNNHLSQTSAQSVKSCDGSLETHFR